MRELFVEGTPFNMCIPDFSMLVCNLAELSEEKLRANLRIMLCLSCFRHYCWSTP